MARAVASPPATSLRERKKRSTREALQRSAVALVAERGLGAVTIDDIAAAAGVSRRTFSNYFAVKEDAIIGWDPLGGAELRDRLVSRPADETLPQALRHVLVESFGHLAVNHSDFQARLRVIRSDPHLLAHHMARFAEAERELVAALDERRPEDPGRDDDYPALVVATALAAGRVALMSWCEHEGSSTLTELLARNLDILSAGLAAPAPRNIDA